MGNTYKKNKKTLCDIKRTKKKDSKLEQEKQQLIFQRSKIAKSSHTKISYALDTINKLYPGKKIVMIFQPHRFSRTKAYWRLFRDVFKKLDQIILLPTYSAGEKNNSYDSSFIYQKIKNKNKLLLKSIDQVKNVLKDINFNNSILVLQGAGDIKDIISNLKRKHDR